MPYCKIFSVFSVNWIRNENFNCYSINNQRLQPNLHHKTVILQFMITRGHIDKIMDNKSLSDCKMCGVNYLSS